MARGDKDEDVLGRYSRLLGANVVSKVRVILKFGEEWLESGIFYDGKEDIIPLAIREGVDGIILPPLHFAKAGRIIKSINQAIEDNFEKKHELNKRLFPRFFLSLNSGSGFMDEKRYRYAFKFRG